MSVTGALLAFPCTEHQTLCDCVTALEASKENKELRPSACVAKWEQMLHNKELVFKVAVKLETYSGMSLHH